MGPQFFRINNIFTPGRLRRSGVGMLFVLLIAALSTGAYQWLDRTYPPPVDRPGDFSVEVLDRHGKHLRIFTNSQGRWRLKTKLDDVDPRFLKMLVAYEDKRFYEHAGIDVLALVRAAGQFVTSGRIVSGGSTISMQLARLLEPRTSRSISAKLQQMFRAMQIERRLSKLEILERYLTLAPYGGNIEGIRAAALSWFGKEPGRLALRESALLVALPQSPERRRPDRSPKRAKDARDRVLHRLAKTTLVSRSEVLRVAKLLPPSRRRVLPQLAPHIAQQAVNQDPFASIHNTHLDSSLQRKLESLTRKSAAKLGPKVSVAIVMADSANGHILTSVGSPGVENEARRGWIDMTQARRSPGSTLKPFVYGLAIEDGLIRPASMIADQPSDFNGYRPTNFDMTYQGDVSVRRALQMSLNIPAVKLMDAVTPARLITRLKRAGVTPRTPNGSEPGLGLVLGGAGLSLTELVQLYSNLISTHPQPLALGDGVRRHPGGLNGRKMLSDVASWHVMDILSGVREPVGSKPLPIGYKTGTSYGHRDAWSVGFDGRYVIGVWVGRADNGPVPGITGIKSAAPILFAAFEKLDQILTPFPAAPVGAIREELSELPVPLRTFQEISSPAKFSNIAQSDVLEVAFPHHGDLLEVPKFTDGSRSPLVIKLQGGVPPFHLLENHRPTPSIFRQRQLFWTPASRGVTQLSVIDAVGQSRSLTVRIR